MRIIRYSPLLRMLYNLNENVMVIGKFSWWSKNEDELIKEGKKVSSEHNLELSILDLDEYLNIITGPYTPHAIVKKLNNIGNIDYFIDYSLNDNLEIKFTQEDMFKGLKFNLNPKKIVINKDFKIFDDLLDIEALENVFGKDNIYFIDEIKDNNEINKIVNVLKSGNVEEYKELTGVPYTVNGFVDHGKKIGRTIGFPTANIAAPEKLLLKEGVYYSKVLLPNETEKREAMSCYWTNGDGDKVIETYIFNFNEDIYGWGIEVIFENFIRDNVEIKSLEELKDLLANDQKVIENKYMKEGK